ncbi:hypothetical protein J6590_026222 [Homalodisca vitripennis]|nr:hypothetical protein J6590_026222 [Homalodisca vitripennis]
MRYLCISSSFVPLLLALAASSQETCKSPPVKERLLADEDRLASPFYVMALPEFRHPVNGLYPPRWIDLNVMSIWLTKRCFQHVLRLLTKIFNDSFRTGRFTIPLKTAKSGLFTTDAAIILIAGVVESIESRKDTLGVFFGLSKAIDSVLVCGNCLLHGLTRTWMTDGPNIKSNLIKNKIEYGVLHRSILSHLPNLIFVNKARSWLHFLDCDPTVIIDDIIFKEIESVKFPLVHLDREVDLKRPWDKPKNGWKKTSAPRRVHFWPFELTLGTVKTKMFRSGTSLTADVEILGCMDIRACHPLPALTGEADTELASPSSKETFALLLRYKVSRPVLFYQEKKQKDRSRSPERITRGRQDSISRVTDVQSCVFKLLNGQ